VLSQAVATDDSLPEDSRALADGDALPEATPEDLASAVGQLQLRELNARLEDLSQRCATDPAALADYRSVSAERNALNERLKQLTQRAAAE
jgi:uncharacterized protein involved in exopolysaccharide biosynthesis